jgi:hypothetical protein
MRRLGKSLKASDVEELNRLIAEGEQPVETRRPR